MLRRRREVDVDEERRRRVDVLALLVRVLELRRRLLDVVALVLSLANISSTSLRSRNAKAVARSLPLRLAWA